MSHSNSPARVAYLGPTGTFTEQALLTQSDLASGEMVPMSTIPGVIQATEAGDVDRGFVPVENAIEGTVNIAMDTIAFESDLLIQREVVFDIRLDLLAVEGVVLDDIKRVISYPHAIAQVRQWLGQNLPEAEAVAANSTADAARLVGEQRASDAAAIGTTLAGSLYDLVSVAEDIGDHPDNQTRFVVVERDRVPPATGHDKTSLVVYQNSNEPGSLLAILQEFAARKIELVKLESRPTRKGLGNYCFMVDFEGHISDEVVADCLVQLRARHGNVKFLGSYPVGGSDAMAQRDDTSRALLDARDWILELRSHVGGR